MTQSAPSRCPTLLPCPFCDSPGEIVKNSFPPRNPWRHPSCSNHDCVAHNQEQDEQGGTHVDCLTDDEALRKWNTRPGHAVGTPWPEPKVTNPDIANPTGVPYLDCLIHRLLDAQQDLNWFAKAEMHQSLADAAALMDEVEAALRIAASRPAPSPEPTREPVATFYICYDGYGDYSMSRDWQAHHVAICYDENVAVDIVLTLNGRASPASPASSREAMEDFLQTLKAMQESWGELNGVYQVSHKDLVALETVYASLASQPAPGSAGHGKGRNREMTIEQLARETLVEKNRRLRQNRCRHEDVYSSSVLGPAGIHRYAFCLDCGRSWNGLPPHLSQKET